MRLCVDFRKLNATTIADTYPLPRMDDLLTEAKSTAYMSTLDLKSGYHQIKVHEADQDKTAFICPFGTYKYLRMPFGLRNAPTTYDIADPAKPDEVLGTYHSSALRAYELPVSRDSGTIAPLR
ncbi:Transposon Ty3-I Gag-Pol polyprotein, partial [Araneus ventricosus]